MRKCILIALITIPVATAAIAQNGPLLVEINGSYRKRHINNDTGQYFKPVDLSSGSVAIRIGYRVLPKLTAGAIVAYGTKDYIQGALVHTPTFTQYYTTTVKATNTTLGLYGRYTYSINDHIFIYGQVEGIKFWQQTRDIKTINYPAVAVPADYTDIPGPADGFLLRIYPALGINIVRGYGLDLSFGGFEWQHYHDDIVTDNSQTINIGKQFNLGIHKFIGRSITPKTPTIK